MMKTKTKLEWKADIQRIEKVKRLAEDIVSRLELVPPIDPILVVNDEHKRLKIKSGNYKNRFDGELEYYKPKQRFILYYNTKYDVGFDEGKHHPRTRFSIAHELGHYYIPKHRAYYLSGGQPHGSSSEKYVDVQMEREADAFASAMLLPRGLVGPLVNEADLTLDTIDEIAEKFGTSRVSTAIRATELSDYVCAAVGIRDGLVCWSACSKSMIEAGIYPPPRGHAGSKNCQAQWESFLGSESRSAERAAIISDWFRTYDKEGMDRLCVAESYIPVPSMGTLVVLLTVPADEVSGTYPGD